jgi:hypothetical protein
MNSSTSSSPCKTTPEDDDDAASPDICLAINSSSERERAIFLVNTD